MLVTIRTVPQRLARFLACNRDQSQKLADMSRRPAVSHRLHADCVLAGGRGVGGGGSMHRPQTQTCCSTHCFRGFSHSRSLTLPTTTFSKQEKELTMPFAVKLRRSQVVYQAANGPENTLPRNKYVTKFKAYLLPGVWAWPIKLGA